MRRPPFLPVVIATVASFALAGCSAGPSRAPLAKASAAVDMATAPVRVGGPGTHGEAHVLPASPAQLKRLAHAGGSPVTLVNVWATWCNPCREEMPALLAVAKRHPEMRLLLVSADFTDHRLEAKTFLEERAVSGTTYIKDGSDQEFIDALNSGWTGSLPATFVFDATGHAVTYWEGRADEAKFEAAIQQAQHPQP